MLEEMSAFFDSRLDIYDEHMLSNIESSHEFYRFTAEHLPKTPECRVLDLGCGTELELEFYFPLNPTAKVTGVDLAPGMLGRLKEKFRGKELGLVQGSYFDVPFGVEAFDAAVSVESLHHFTVEEKTPLYKKLREALRPGGYFILTDYFALTDEEEAFHRGELLRLKREHGVPDGAFYHYDTPLTVQHETKCLRAAGFAAVEVLKSWGATHTMRASR